MEILLYDWGIAIYSQSGIWGFLFETLSSTSWIKVDKVVMVAIMSNCWFLVFCRAEFHSRAVHAWKSCDWCPWKCWVHPPQPPPHPPPHPAPQVEEPLVFPGVAEALSLDAPPAQEKMVAVMRKRAAKAAQKMKRKLIPPPPSVIATSFQCRAISFIFSRRKSSRSPKFLPNNVNIVRKLWPFLVFVYIKDKVGSQLSWP